MKKNLQILVYYRSFGFVSLGTVFSHRYSPIYGVGITVYFEIFSEYVTQHVQGESKRGN